MGKQTQLDWKESIQFLLTTGETVTINIFVLLLSYSRFWFYRLSVSKTQDVLLSFMDDAFGVFGGIPDEIVTDNIKTVMYDPRTEYQAGKVNVRFQQFADDYGFKVRPCIAKKAKDQGLSKEIRYVKKCQLNPVDSWIRRRFLYIIISAY